MSEQTRASAAHDPSRSAGERDAVATAQMRARLLFDQYKNGQAGIAQTVAALRIIVDDLFEQTFEGAGRGVAGDRITALLRANGVEVERRCRAEDMLRRIKDLLDGRT